MKTLWSMGMTRSIYPHARQYVAEEGDTLHRPELLQGTRHEVREHGRRCIAMVDLHFVEMIV